MLGVWSCANMKSLELFFRYCRRCRSRSSQNIIIRICFKILSSLWYMTLYFKNFLSVRNKTELFYFSLFVFWIISIFRFYSQNVFCSYTRTSRWFFPSRNWPYTRIYVLMGLQKNYQKRELFRVSAIRLRKFSFRFLAHNCI